MTAIVYDFIGADVQQKPDRGVAEPTKPRLVHVAAATDRDLLADVCNGDQSAFAEIAGRHYDAVYRVVWRVMGGPDDAEDVTQEAFLKLWQAPHTLRDGNAVKSWLMRVAGNLAIDRARRRRPQTVDALPDVADGGPSQHLTLSRAQVAAQVNSAIAGLPDRQRLALVLTYYEHFGNQQTADIMDLSVDAVESLISRARRNLKTRLAADWRDMLDELSRE